MFLQIHTLTSYPASLLNRDDAGLAKRIPFGNATRLRISSQCLKKHWRDALLDRIDLPRGYRTRHFFSRIVLPRLIEEKGLDEQTAHELTATLVAKLITGKGNKNDPLAMSQPALFGQPEADYFVDLIAQSAQGGDNLKEAKKKLEEAIKASKKNFSAMLKQAGYGDLASGVEGALFGRFVTSDILARTDAAVHVAHAFTIHALDTEVDYFTVVDDLNTEEETGAAHAGDMELGAGLYYNYIAIDLPLLVSNFTGCDPKQWRQQPLDDVKQTLEQLMHIIATVSPGAKLGSTAPYARAEFVLFEASDDQPRSLANAWLKASQQADMEQAIRQADEHLQALDQMYGFQGQRHLSTLYPQAIAIKSQPFAQAVQAILDFALGE